MSTTGFWLVVLITIITALFLVLPFLSRRRTTPDEDDSTNYSQQVAAYERVLLTIRDLDEDYSTHKLDEVSYQTEREHWVQQGITLLQVMDVGYESLGGDAVSQSSVTLDESTQVTDLNDQEPTTAS